MEQQTQIKDFDTLLDESSADDAFKDAVRELEGGGKPERIAFNSASPPVKVLRFIMKLLEDFPDAEFSSIEVQGRSGCSDFVGQAVAQPGDLRFEFVWDCAWRAEQEGWTDAFGDPDQIRAARTFGYQCFRKLAQL